MIEAPSAFPIARSLPARELASATGYHVLSRGAFGKLPLKLAGPALPRTPWVVVQGVSGPKFAAILIVIALESFAPQMFAASSKTLSLCCPSVVPGFPPTGIAGVGSLKPTPA